MTSQASETSSPSEEQKPPSLPEEGKPADAPSKPSDRKRNSTKVEWAPIAIPMSRRRQTLTVYVWVCSALLFVIASLFLIRSSGWSFYLFLFYLGWMFLFQRFHINGGHRNQFFRKLKWWQWFRDYFPVSLHKTAELPPTKSYLFGYHPHGIIGMGAFVNFATEATGFEEKYPGINLRLLTLRSNFFIPFYGIYLTLLGICDASAESCLNILSRGHGHSIMLVLGGAKEALDAHPGTYDLTLKNRKGFVKIALETGSSLVPVLSFGENDLFEQVPNPQGSRIRKIQNALQDKLGFSLPLIKGRGAFQYSYGLLPQRRPIRTVVGAPIDLPKMSKEQIVPADINKYHDLYIEALTKLFDTYKDQFALDRRSSLNLVQ